MRNPRCWCWIFLLGFTAFSGCVTTPAHNRPAKGRLSDVMKKASDQYQGDRNLAMSDPHHDDGESVWFQVPIVSAAAVEPATPAPAATPAEHPPRPAPVHTLPPRKPLRTDNLWFGVRGGSGAATNAYFFRTGGFDLVLEAYNGSDQSARLVAGFHTMSVRDNGNLVSTAVEGEPVVLGFGGEYKFYETPETSFFGFYFLAGLQFNLMTWTYRNTVWENHENPIASDALGGMDIYPCLGARLLQTEPVILGLELRPGVKVWQDQTQEGYDNDLFHPVPYVRLDVTALFRIP